MDDSASSPASSSSVDASATNNSETATLEAVQEDVDMKGGDGDEKQVEVDPSSLNETLLAPGSPLMKPVSKRSVSNSTPSSNNSATEDALGISAVDLNAVQPVSSDDATLARCNAEDVKACVATLQALMDEWRTDPHNSSMIVLPVVKHWNAQNNPLRLPLGQGSPGSSMPVIQLYAWLIQRCDRALELFAAVFSGPNRNTLSVNERHSYTESVIGLKKRCAERHVRCISAHAMQQLMPPQDQELIEHADGNQNHAAESLLALVNVGLALFPVSRALLYQRLCQRLRWLLVRHLHAESETYDHYRLLLRALEDASGEHAQASELQQVKNVVQAGWSEAKLPASSSSSLPAASSSSSSAAAETSTSATVSLSDSPRASLLADRIAEDPEWVQPVPGVRPIQPGSPEQTGLPFRDLVDESSPHAQHSPQWTKWTSEQVGTIIFGERKAPDKATGTGSQKEFTYGQDIKARAFWARAVRNYPIGVDKLGRPVYGADAWSGEGMIVEFSVRMYIDGKEVQNPYMADNAMGWFNSRGGLRNTVWDLPQYSQLIGTRAYNGIVDFYAWNQSVQFPLTSHVAVQANTEWARAPLRYQQHLSRLSPGKHVIKLSLHFRLIKENSVMPAPTAVLQQQQQQQGNLGFDVPFSHPIAEGEFVLNMPDASVPRPLPVQSIYYPRAPECDATPAARTASAVEEKACIKALAQSTTLGLRRVGKPQQPVYCSVGGDWYESEHEMFPADDDDDDVGGIQEVVQYGKPVLAYFYRDPRHGWQTEHFAVYHLSVYTPKVRNPPRRIPPIWNFGIGTSWTLMMDQVCAADLERIKNRTPREKRLVYIDD